MRLVFALFIVGIIVVSGAATIFLMLHLFGFIGG